MIQEQKREFIMKSYSILFRSEVTALAPPLGHGGHHAADELPHPDLDHGSIRLEGVRAFGHHGVLAEERRDGQEFVIDVDLSVAIGRAARSDRVAGIDAGRSEGQGSTQPASACRASPVRRCVVHSDIGSAPIER